MAMNASYYFWKWADNDLPGKPNEVFAALMRGDLHPALQTFDASPLLERLEATSADGRKRGEEWDWTIQSEKKPRHTAFVHLTCPQLDALESRMRGFSGWFARLGLSGYDEQYGHLIQCAWPKLNCFIRGQYPHELDYDIKADDLPVLLRSIRPGGNDPFAILEDRRYYFVQCCAQGRRFRVEWRENYDCQDWSNYCHWCAGAPRRLATLEGKASSVKQKADENPEELSFSNTLRIFEAFLLGKQKPSRYNWRSIKEALETKEKKMKVTLDESAGKNERQ